MTIKSRFFSDLKIVFVAQIVASSAMLLFTIWAGRQLGADKFALFQALMVLYYAAASFNLPLYLMSIDTTGREVPSVQMRVGAEFLKFVFIASFFLGVLVIICSQWLGLLIDAPSKLSCIVVALMLISKEPLTCAYGLIQGTGKHTLFGRIKISESLLLLVFGVAILSVYSQAEGAVLTYALPAFISLGICAWYEPKLFSELRSARIPPFRRFLPAIPLLLYLLLLNLLSGLPLLISRGFLSTEESSILAALYNLRSAVFPFALAVVIPFYIKCLNRSSTKENLLLVLLINLGMGICFSLLLGLFPEKIFKLLYHFPLTWTNTTITWYCGYIITELLVLPLLFLLAGKSSLKVIVVVAPVICWMCFLTLNPELSAASLVFYQCVSGFVFLFVASIFAFQARKEI